jgi:hypothetical protein
VAFPEPTSQSLRALPQALLETVAGPLIPSRVHPTQLRRRSSPDRVRSRRRAHPSRSRARTRPPPPLACATRPRGSVGCAAVRLRPAACHVRLGGVERLAPYFVSLIAGLDQRRAAMRGESRPSSPRAGWGRAPSGSLPHARSAHTAPPGDTPNRARDTASPGPLQRVESQTDAVSTPERLSHDIPLAAALKRHIRCDRWRIHGGPACATAGEAGQPVRLPAPQVWRSQHGAGPADRGSLPMTDS